MDKSMFKEFSTIELAKYYAEECELFYLPYGGPEEGKFEYEFRKTMLEVLRDRLEEEYHYFERLLSHEEV